ncbi:hypothetical protein [Variovorax atrisoli]|uniref:hypothetical protein n=1 Tax=Variovorax atrisoli TaxID=3394203 RepID=UPI003399BA31
MIVEILGALYAPLKDLYRHHTSYPEKDKLVDFQWPESSGFSAKLREQGWDVKWSRPDLVARRIDEDWQVMYEIDEKNKVIYRLVLRDGLVLIGKRSEGA